MIWKSFIIFFCLHFFASAAYSHPHIFLTNKIEVVFDQKGISGFKTFWYADDFSTAGLTDGYDENEDGNLDEQEMKEFEQDSFNNLKKYHYFTYLKLNGKHARFKSVQDFKASLINNKIVFSFFIPFKIPAKTKDTEIMISQYDKDYFSFISFADQNPVKLINNKDFQSFYDIKENKNETYYFGSVHPVVLFLRFKKT